ncbi:MAG: hypothetical protein AB7D06_08340 [Pedobacter sp.]
MKSRKFNILAVLAALLFLASSAQAAVVVGGSDGWSFSTDGMVNLFGIYQTGDARPSGVLNGITLSDDQEGFRLRSGFLPGILAFNIKAPTIGGLDMAARVGFYPNPQNANTKNSFSTQIDLREIFFTVDGNFGQVMVGKGLSLFLGQNTLTAMSLMGSGIAGAVGGGGTTLGNIGYGYIYPQFNAQVRYTTPDFHGFKLALGIYDPSQIGTSGAIGDGAARFATKTTTPRVEGELSYAGAYGDTTYKVWGNFLYQEAEFQDTGDSVEANGYGGGIQVGFMGFELVASGFGGQALGSTLMLDTDSLDPVNEERDSMGYLLQGTYTFDNAYGKTKLGICYGANEMDETSYEKGVRTGGGDAELEEQNMLTFLVSHDINPFLKLVFEYSIAENQWFDGSDQKVDLINLGTFFVW